MHKVMAELRGLGHVEQVKLRDKGKFTGVVYTVHGADTFQQPSGQKPDTPTPDASKPDAYWSTTRTDDQPGDERHTNQFYADLHQTGDDSSDCGDGQKLCGEWWSSPKFVEFAFSVNLADVETAYDDDELISKIAAAAPNEEIADALDRATANRIGNQLRPVAIDEVQRLAACVLGTGTPDDCSPDDAIKIVLRHVRKTIGDRGGWLNSFEIVAFSLFNDLVGQKPKTALTERDREIIERLNEADLAGVLADNMLTQASLKRFYWLEREFGFETLDIVARKLVACVMNDTSPGSVRSWGYFRGHLEDEQRRQVMEEEGLKPGDCPDWQNMEL